MRPILCAVLFAAALIGCSTTNPETGERERTVLGSIVDALTADDEPRRGTLHMDDGTTYEVEEQ